MERPRRPNGASGGQRPGSLDPGEKSNGSIKLTLAKAMVSGRVLPSGWEEVSFGAGIPVEEFRSALYPALAHWMSAKIASDPSGDLATILMDLFDNRCNPDPAGCDPPPEDCLPDGVIHAEELTCNALIDELMAPDVDLSGDGIKDHLSFGLQIMRTVPVTVVTQ